MSIINKLDITNISVQGESIRMRVTKFEPGSLSIARCDPCGPQHLTSLTSTASSDIIIELLV